MRPSRPFHVMVIDDDPVDRYLAEEALREHDTALTITSCVGGRDALTCLDDLERDHRALPDVIVLDLHMPEMPGLDVLAELKAHTAFTEVPVVVLSTSSNREDVREAYARRASSYLIKAYSYATFLTQMEDFLAYWKHVTTPRQLDW